MLPTEPYGRTSETSHSHRPHPNSCDSLASRLAANEEHRTPDVPRRQPWERGTDREDPTSSSVSSSASVLRGERQRVRTNVTSLRRRGDQKEQVFLFCSYFTLCLFPPKGPRDSIFHVIKWESGLASEPAQPCEGRGIVWVKTRLCSLSLQL